MYLVKVVPISKVLGWKQWNDCFSKVYLVTRGTYLFWVQLRGITVKSTFHSEIFSIMSLSFINSWMKDSIFESLRFLICVRICAFWWPLRRVNRVFQIEVDQGVKMRYHTIFARFPFDNIADVLTSPKLVQMLQQK